MIVRNEDLLKLWKSDVWRALVLGYYCCTKRKISKIHVTICDLWSKGSLCDSNLGLILIKGIWVSYSGIHCFEDFLEESGSTLEGQNQILQVWIDNMFLPNHFP